MLPHESIITDAEIRKRPSVQLDYTKFHRTDPLTLWKNRLIVGLGAAAILLCFWWWISGKWRGGNSPAFSPGDLAAVHSTWDSQCQVCHSSHESAGRGWGPQTFGVSHTPDQLCQACHAGPVHHASERSADTPTCAACHLDHQGRNAMMTRNSDRYCTVCHANLANHFADGFDKSKSRLAESKIGDWASHPDFHMPKDPGRLKFNHKLHLSPGMASDGGSPLITVGQLNSSSRAGLNITATDPNLPVQLDCASCHRPDSYTGAVMQPISYPQHCQGCHPLTVQLPDDKKKLEIPHGWQPGPLRELLEGLLIGRAMENKKEALNRPPWQLPGKDEPLKLTVAERLAAVERDAIASKKLCAECHFFEGEVGKGTLLGLKVQPTNVPTRWFQQAKFNHASHRLLDCRGCHIVDNSTSADTVAIPNIENCKQCHGPQQSTADGMRGGVSYGCVECHSYHNGDHPGLGKGAMQRAPEKRLLEQFLKP